MKVGDMQSVFQITVALNLAYFSFREIRTPVVVSYEKMYADVARQIDEARATFRMIAKPEKLTFGEELSSLSAKREWFDFSMNVPAENLKMMKDPYQKNMQDIDKGMRAISISLAAVGFTALFLSAAFAALDITILWFAMITAILLSPIIFAIFYNWMISGMISKDHDEFRLISAEVKKMQTEFSEKYLSRYLEILPAKAEEKPVGS